MPRHARLDVSGALHHIMVCGINSSAIFKDDQDKNRFLNCFSVSTSSITRAIDKMVEGTGRKRNAT